MATRTYKQVERDFRAIKKYVNKHTEVKSIKEIATALGLTVSQVQTSLSRHARVRKDIDEMMEKNRREYRNQMKDDNLAKKARKESDAESVNDSQKNHEDAEERVSDNFERFVIDASIMGIDGLFDIFNEICSQKGKLVLTSMTIKELEKMQMFKDCYAKDARRILALAAENEDGFECVLIDEKQGTPDDSIIKYCADNKDSVVLMTADKTMSLKARTLGVRTRFFKHTRIDIKETTKSCYPKKQTLYDAKKCDGKLVINEMEKPFRKILVISKGIEYNSGPRNLNVGDDVYIASKKEEYITFSHFKVTSLDSEKNCVFLYGTRLHALKDLERLPKGSYRSFMKAFLRNKGFSI